MHPGRRLLYVRRSYPIYAEAAYSVGRVRELVRLLRHVVHALIVVPQLRERADEVGAAREYPQLCHGPPVLVLKHAQPLVHGHPAVQPVVARLREGNAVLGKYVRHAPARLLPRGPEVRRREIGCDLVAAHHVQHGLGRLAHYESPGVLAEVPALIHLAYDIGHVVFVHRDEVGRQHVEAVVDCHVAPPPGRRLEGRHDMHVPVPLAEILACEHVPGAVEPGLSQLIWQGLEHVYVLGVLFHQHGVVRDLGLDKLVVVRALVASILSVNKEPFHPGMANSAGVAGEVHALGEVVRAAQGSP